MDFTLKKYEDLLKSIRSNYYKVYGIHDWVKQKPDKGIVIRHDVDRNALNSLKVAELEAKYDIRTTYFFRITSNSFKPEIIKAIKNLGHEIGYHYEDLSITKGDFEKAIKLFEKHLNSFKNLAEVKTITMHGSPLSKHNNMDIWKKYDFKKFKIDADAFFSIDYSNMYYFTDTGRSWSNNSSNLRDRVDSMDAEINNTDDLIKFIRKNSAVKIALVTHPERWNESMSDYCVSYISDISINLIKRIIKLIRG